MPSLAISYSGLISRSFFTFSTTRPCHVVDLFLGVEAAEAEADGAVRHVLLDAQRAQHVRRLERGRGAGRARRHRHVLDRHHQRLALDVGEGDVEVARAAGARASR